MNSLTDFIGSKNCINLIKTLQKASKNGMYQSEIIKRSGVSQNTAIKILKSLKSFEIVNEEVIGGLKFYSLVDNNPILKQVKILISVSELYEVLKDISLEHMEIYLFGSAARGEDKEDSDYDILFIGKMDNESFTMLTEKIEIRLSRSLNAMLKTPIDYADSSRINRAFYENIEKDKIRLL